MEQASMEQASMESGQLGFRHKSGESPPVPLSSVTRSFPCCDTEGDVKLYIFCQGNKPQFSLQRSEQMPWTHV